RWLNNSPCAEAARKLIANGYGFDFISDRQLQDHLTKSKKVIIVPQTKHIPLATLENLLERVEKGEAVIFLDGLPEDVPGYLNYEERRRQLRTLLNDRDSLVVNSDSLSEKLQSVGIHRELMVDQGLDFVRRTHADGHHYFVANMSGKPVSDWIPLGSPLKSAVIMDPQSARTGVATIRDGHQIFLQLLPGETRIIRTFQNKAVEGPRWPLLTSTDDSTLTITGTWNVCFVDGGPELPSEISMPSLKSWTEIENREGKRFAGTARYTLDFDLPETPADDWILDLGEVRESARVIINGQKAASLYSVPFQSPVGQFLKPGRNRIEIEVTNLSTNRIRDLDRRKVDWKIFHDINIVDHNYKPFDASRWKLMPSGLLGPVTLAPKKRLDP
ncbi:MAG TPA: hypothetical protein VNQ76_01220, partial [Planctomicrobium sp.]|nr:hypothetical protein [Planctomicrobium sp.]